MNKREFQSEFERVNRKYEVAFMPRIKRALHTKVSATISRLQDGGYEAATKYLHSTMGNEAVGRAVKQLYITVGTRHARMNYSRLLVEQKRFGWNAAWTLWIENYLADFLLDKVTFDIAATTRDALLRALTAGLSAGLSADEMVNKLKDWPYERFQAARIVRTEVGRAANVGATAQSRTSEYQQMKEWISSHDFRVRGHKPNEHANHVQLDGTKIDQDDSFRDVINGDELQFPGDPKASAASTINCRCSVAYTLKRDAQGNPIPKRKSTVVIFPGQTRRVQTVTI